MELAITTSLLTATLAGITSAQIYDFKSNAPAGVQPSSAPAVLFSFNENGSGFTSIGTISLVTGGQIDADGLALSLNHGLMAFWVTANGSTLMNLNSSTAVGTTVGSMLGGRDVRGAAFDMSDRMWAVDAASNELIRIDPLTGNIIGGPLSVHTGTGALDISNGADLALHASGAMYLVMDHSFYTIDVAIGLATLLGSDSTVSPHVNFLPGAAFSMNAPADRLFAYEANGSDDLFYYDLNVGFNPNTLLVNIISSFNSGRGDLAWLMIPAPAGSTLLGLAGVALLRRRR